MTCTYAIIFLLAIYLPLTLNIYKRLHNFHLKKTKDFPLFIE